MMSGSSCSNEVLAKKKADILRTLSYLDVAAHLLSRGVISMPEHRQIFTLSDEVSRVNKLLDIISDRKDSARHLMDAMEDDSLRGKYGKLIRLIQAEQS